MLLKKFINHFVKDKKIIIAQWLKSKDTLYILEKYEISKSYFVENYALGVLNYYFAVVNGEKLIGDCPVIDDLIVYLKDKNLRSDELFLLCSGFKNSMVTYAFSKDYANHEVVNEINYIFEQNFAGVLNKYSKSLNEVEIALKNSLDVVNKSVIMSKTDRKGFITEVSNAFCEISGYTKEELVGNPHSIVRHPDTSSLIFKDLWDTILNGKVWKGEIKNKKKDGSYYWVEATIEPNFDKNRKIIGFYAVRQDITSKKRAQEQHDILIEQSKSAAMGEMISMIAHQWRQPLQAVSILTQKLPLTKIIEGEISDEVLNQVVDDIGSQLDYMSKTIDDFRDFFKPHKEKEKILVSSIINKATDFLAYMLKVDLINIKVEFEEDFEVFVHINELVQVLINIFKNARDVMIEREIENRELKINFFKEQSNMVLTIEDNAKGIPKNIIDKIFEPYFSTKTNKNGTGLGLYMSKMIIEQHSNGIISVENSKIGALFKIELPLK